MIAYVSCSRGVQFCWVLVNFFDMNPTGAVRRSKMSSLMGIPFKPLRLRTESRLLESQTVRQDSFVEALIAHTTNA